ASVLFFFFFFQAEDGIRDLIVTGVQTCALPISKDAGRTHGLPRRATLCRRPCVRPASFVLPPRCNGPHSAMRMKAEIPKASISRSEERRVGKECRTRMAWDQ